MQPNTDYKKLLTEVIQKQMIILGPNITLTKARNVKGLIISDDGTVTDIQGPPQELIQNLINQFVQLSGLIVEKTMEPLLSAYPDGVPDPDGALQAAKQLPSSAPKAPSASAAQEAINKALGNKT